jgi:hypothetical protein
VPTLYSCIFITSECAGFTIFSLPEPQHVKLSLSLIEHDAMRACWVVV